MNSLHDLIENVTLDIILCGSQLLSPDINKEILVCVHQYIRSSKRFLH